MTVAPAGAGAIVMVASTLRREPTCRSSPAARTRSDEPSSTSVTVMSRSARSLNGPSRSMSTAVYRDSGSMVSASSMIPTQPMSWGTSVSDSHAWSVVDATVMSR